MQTSQKKSRLPSRAKARAKVKARASALFVVKKGITRPNAPNDGMCQKRCLAIAATRCRSIKEKAKAKQTPAKAKEKLVGKPARERAKD